MEALLGQGVEVYAICPPGAYNTRLEALGCRVVNYDIVRESINPFKELHATVNIYHAIKDLKLDLLHTFTAKPNIYGTFAARKAKVPVVLQLVEGLGSLYVENSFKNRIVRFIMEHLYKKAFSLGDGAVFVNSDDPRYMVEQGLIEPSKVHIIKSVGVDTQKFNPSVVKSETLEKLRESLHVTNQTVVLMVARAIWHKGIREYYAAAEQLRDQNILFLLVGDIDPGNPSSAERGFLNSGNVLWLEHRDDITALTALCNIYVLPSYYREGVPRTLLEAASMAKPIVTTDVVGCREVVRHGENGLLVPPQNASKLAEAIKHLIDHPDLRHRMGEHGRIMATKAFDIKIVVSRYLELYNQFLHFETHVS